MRNRYPVTIHLICVLPLLLTLLAVTVLVGTGDEVTQFYRQYRYNHETLTAFMRFLTDWGNPALYVVYAFLLWRGIRNGNQKQKRFVLTYIVIQLLVALVLVRIFKVAIGRPRPGEGVLFQPGSFDSAYNSLPSGHTAEITGASIPLAYYAGRYAPSLLMGLFIALIGFTRIYLGMHHTSDVFFGMLTGSFAAFAIHSFWNRYDNE